MDQEKINSYLNRLSLKFIDNKLEIKYQQTHNI